MEPPQGVGGAARAIHGTGEAVEPLEVRVHLETGILPAGDRQRSPGQVDTAVRPRDKLGKLQERRVGVHQQPGA